MLHADPERAALTVLSYSALSFSHSAMPDDTSVFVAPVRADDPKKKKDEEKEEKLGGSSKEDASKDKSKEGEELVRRWLENSFQILK